MWNTETWTGNSTICWVPVLKSTTTTLARLSWKNAMYPKCAKDLSMIDDTGANPFNITDTIESLSVSSERNELSVGLCMHRNRPPVLVLTSAMRRRGGAFCNGKYSYMSAL